MTKARTGAFALALTVVAIIATGLGHWRSHLYMYGRPGAPATFSEAPAAVAETHVTVRPSTPAPTTSETREHQADLGPEPPAAPDPTDANASAGAPPNFDVVRVEPTGDTLVAGKARPNSSVELMNGGQVVGKTTSDADGNFVLLPAPLKPGAYDLSLRAVTNGAKTATHSKQSVAVSVPASKSGQVVVALAEPGKPSQLLSNPSRDASVKRPDEPAPTAEHAPSSDSRAGSNASASAQSSTATAIQSVEVENQSGVHVSGEGKPGARTEVYLNDSHLASVQPDRSGHWSVTVRKGLTGGHYAVRADTIGGKGRVTARVEVPFDVPRSAAVDSGKPGADAAVASAAPKADTGSHQPANASTPLASAQSSGDAIVDAVETALVVRGDNLWDISRSRLGAGQRYTRIYASNVSQIRDPKLIYPGQVFVVPAN